MKKEEKEVAGSENIIFDGTGVGLPMIGSYLKAFHFSAEEEELIAEKGFKPRSGTNVTVACFTKNTNNLSQNFRPSTKRM